ncbi:class I mannose-6-phosphate isomerase [Novosphingobium sp.]|uniref:class I mannose-6-phosphate isomerase n=1 Tax=Novosphingobium sp. TaxID=1874826 RepID=UPI00333F3B0D
MNRLPIRAVEKPWGKDVLPPPFTAPVGQRIGEIWFEPPATLPSVLVKYIFTSEKLSVQVHPDDAQAAAAGEHDTGKEECWLVIAAEPGASLGVGFTHKIGPEAMRRAALDGSIEALMDWYPVQPGDFFYIPAGTVHAIGAGVSLIEIQQCSDITYRLYDYGRPRPLHLDAGIAVAHGEPHDPALRRHIAPVGTVELAHGRYFQAHRIAGVPDAALRAIYAGPVLILPRVGTITAGDTVLQPGDCAVTRGLDGVAFAGDGQAIVVRATV